MFKFEYKIKHPCAGAIFDVNHSYRKKDFDEIILIRCIELNKKAIAKDLHFLLPFTPNTMNYLYKNYCSTTCYDLSKVNYRYIRDAINLAFLHSFY